MNRCGMLIVCVIGLFASVGLDEVHAEHRVALLIGMNEYQDQALTIPKTNLQPIADAFAKYGVRSRILENLPGDKLREELDRFVSSTPTRGTAIVYFRGHLLPGDYKGKRGRYLVGINGKQGDARSNGNAGISLDQLLEKLSKKGGSETNLVIVDRATEAENSESPSEPSQELPSGSALAFSTATTLVKTLTGNGNLLAELKSTSNEFTTSLPADSTITGKGTPVVSPPEKFVLGNRAGDEWVNSRGMVFCWCPPGRYVAGSPEDEEGRYPDETQHEVNINGGFWIGKYEMTLRENLRNHPRNTLASHKNDPLTMINHDDARQMTTRTLTQAEQKANRLPQDWQYSLPTEEQWEYAARAGTATRFYFGDDESELPQHANFGDKTYYDSGDIYSNSAHRTLNDGSLHLAKVGSYQPNPWGLHDICGNVAEWCINTAIRGGSWTSTPDSCRSAHLDSFSSRNEQNFIGYRLVIQKTPSNRPKK